MRYLLPALCFALAFASCSDATTAGDGNYPPGGTDPVPAAPPSGGNGTHWTSQYPQFFGIARGNAGFVAVGEVGSVHTSPDGKNWTPRPTGRRESLFDVAWDGTQYVAVGDQGLLLRSLDGVTWTASPTVQLSSRKFNAVAWNGTQFCAVGPGGLTAWSTDGATWQSALIGGGVAVGPMFNDIAVAGNQFIAVGRNISLSSDCQSWSGFGSGFGGDTMLTSVAWSPTLKLYVAGGRVTAGPIVYSSPDANTWTPHPLQATGVTVAEPGGIEAVAWDAKLSAFIAVGNAEFDRTTGIGWPAGSGRQPTIAYASSDGLSWAAGSVPPGQTGLSALACDGGCVAVGEIGNVMTAGDGKNWAVQRSLNTPGVGFTDVAWGNGQFVAVGYKGTIATSPDGRAWTVRDSGQTEDLGSPVWSGTQWLVGASNRPGGFVLASPDGVVWSRYSTGDSQLGAIRGLVWTGRHFVGGDLDSFLATSVDGQHWRYLSGGTAVNGAQDLQYNALHWIDGKLVSATSEGTGVAGGVSGYTSSLQSTSDGTNWTPETTASGITVDFTRTTAGFWILLNLSGDAPIRYGSTGTGSLPVSLSGGFVGQATFGLDRVANTGTLMVAVGGNPITGRNDIPASIYTATMATQGSVWQSQWSSTTQSLRGVAWDGKVFVAVGGSNYPAIVTSD